MRLLNVAVLFAADATNVQRAAEMLVRRVFFFSFRAFFDRCYGFDRTYSFSLPRLGAARLRESKALFRLFARCRVYPAYLSPLST